VAFVARQLPQPEYSCVLDVACGEGRHALGLARHGYRVVGVDRDASALALARVSAGREITFVEQDMRELDRLSCTFDAAIVLWQSFGYFDDMMNREVLRLIRDKLAPDGRLILDLYHRGFFEQHQGTRTLSGTEPPAIERKYMNGARLIVELDYGRAGAIDRFDWRLYTPDELTATAEEIGFTCLLMCSGFDEQSSAVASAPRMQVVFQKI
jgi:SAM-dependent methyltransferase